MNNYEWFAVNESVSDIQIGTWVTTKQITK